MLADTSSPCELNISADHAAATVAQMAPPMSTALAATSNPTNHVPLAVRQREVRRSRKVYGFVWSPEELHDIGTQEFLSIAATKGPDDPMHERIANGETDPMATGFGMLLLHARARRAWKATTKHTVVSPAFPGDFSFCLAVADNKSRATVTPPPKEDIERLKTALGVDQEPEWRVRLD